MTERLRFGMLLAVIGGFMDVYSYLVRGGVFATGQTGNFVLLAVAFLEQNPVRAVRAAVPILCFWLGVFLSHHLLHVFFTKEVRRWKQAVLFLEVLLLIVVGLIPDEITDLIPNAVISFSAAMQFCCFRNFGENSAYATVFCTGNMRSCAECYYKGIVLKDKKQMHKALGYTCILLAFFTGVCIGGVLAYRFGIRAIWGNAVLAGAALLVFLAGEDKY